MEVRVDQRRGQTLFLSSRLVTSFFFFFTIIIMLLFRLTNALCCSLTMRLELSIRSFIHSTCTAFLEQRPAPQRFLDKFKLRMERESNLRDIEIIQNKLALLFLSFLFLIFFLALHQRRHRLIVFLLFERHVKKPTQQV